MQECLTVGMQVAMDSQIHMTAFFKLYFPVSLQERHMQATSNVLKVRSNVCASTFVCSQSA